MYIHSLNFLGVGIAQYSDRQEAGWPGFDPQHCKIFLFSMVSRLTLGPTQSPSLRAKHQRCEADHSAASTEEIKPPIPHMSYWHSVNCLITKQ